MGSMLLERSSIFPCLGKQIQQSRHQALGHHQPMPQAVSSNLCTSHLPTALRETIIGWYSSRSVTAAACVDIKGGYDEQAI